MSKIGILVCSNAGLDYLEYNQNIKIMRSILNIESKEYNDFIDIDAQTFYNKITEDKNLKISTSQTPTGVILEFYERFKCEGYTDVIVITISSKMSGTISGAKLASEMIDGLNVHLFDSKSLSYSEAYLALTASKMALENKDISEILEELNRIRDNQRIYVVVDTLHYLVLNGRLSTLNGVLGTLLQMKPLLYINEEGSLVTKEKIRTKNKAKEKLVDVILEDIKDKKIVLYAAYTDNKEETEEIINNIKNKTNSTIVDTVLVPLTPVVGCHAGPKTCGIGYIIVK